MTPGPSRLRGGNVVHRIELPRRRWPARGRFVLGWPEGAPPLPTPLADPADAAPAPAEAPEREAHPTRGRKEAPEVARRPAPAPPAPGSVSELDAAREAAFRKEIRQLERRLRKMNGLLEDREDELRRLVANGRVDSGLASLYREVQGIRDDSPLAETKREMMSSIFEANRKLQGRLRELEHGEGPGRQGDAGAA